MGRGILIILVFLLGLPMSSIAQRSGNSTLYDTGMNLKPSGLFIGVGMNGLMTMDEERTDVHHFGLQTSYLTTYKRETKPAIGFRFGYFWALQRGFIRTIEFGAAFKKRRGYESAHAVRQGGADVTFEENIYANGQFTHHSITLSLDPTIVWGLGRKAFLHHGPGLEYDMVVRRKESYSTSILPLNVDDTGDESYLSFTYGAGIGFKTSERAYLLIGARAVLAHPFSDDSPTARRSILNSRYRPYSIFLTYQWLKKRSDIACGSSRNFRRGGRFSHRKRRSSHKPW